MGEKVVGLVHAAPQALHWVGMLQPHQPTQAMKPLPLARSLSCGGGGGSHQLYAQTKESRVTERKEEPSGGGIGV